MEEGILNLNLWNIYRKRRLVLNWNTYVLFSYLKSTISPICVFKLLSNFDLAEFSQSYLILSFITHARNSLIPSQVTKSCRVFVFASSLSSLWNSSFYPNKIVLHWLLPICKICKNQFSWTEMRVIEVVGWPIQTVFFDSTKPWHEWCNFLLLLIESKTSLFLFFMIRFHSRYII